MKEYRYEIQNLIDELGIELEESKDLFLTYISEMNKLVGEIKGDITKGEKLCQTIHSIKGLAGNFYINDVYEDSKRFELLLKENSSIDLLYHVNNLIEHISEAEKEVRRFFYDNNMEL